MRSVGGGGVCQLGIVDAVHDGGGRRTDAPYGKEADGVGFLKPSVIIILFRGAGVRRGVRLSGEAACRYLQGKGNVTVCRG